MYRPVMACLRAGQARDGAAQGARAGVQADLGQLGRGLDRGLQRARRWLRGVGGAGGGVG